MKQRYHYFRRENGIYYSLDTLTNKRQSLKTTSPAEAQRLVNALTEACIQPAINLQIAQVYLQHSDPEFSKRTWRHVMDEMAKSKDGSTLVRWQTAMNDKAFDLIRDMLLIKTQGEHFLEVLHRGTVSTNVFLRRLHNFAFDLDWIPKSIIPKRQWPKIEFASKRAITLAEHLKILAGERNPEWRAYYNLIWHFGAAQSDLAALCAEDLDWENRVVSFHRFKTGTLAQLHFGNDAADILSDLAGEGPLFPRIGQMTESDRASLFRRRCRLVGVSGVTLHSYRYAWAERAREAGYPERFAQEALGHNSIAVHRAYAKKAKVKIPSLEEFERKIAPLAAVLSH